VVCLVDPVPAQTDQRVPTGDTIGHDPVKMAPTVHHVVP
jgi:hypothetical protein